MLKRIKKEKECLQAALRTFEKRQQEFQEYIEVLENEIGQMEAETAQGLMEREVDLEIQLASLQEDTEGKLEGIVQNLSAQIQSSQEEHIVQFARMRNRVETLSVDFEQKKEIAGQWLYSVETLRNFIESHYDHASFLPGYFLRIDCQMQQAVSNLQEGMPEAALMGAQQIYFDCSQARLELERRISEWQILQQTALAAMDKLYKDIASSNFIPAVDLSGVELPIMIDLDQWSGLPYNRILRQAKSLLSRLRARSQSLTAADLKDLTENGIPRIEKEFNEIIYKARMEVVYSQIRINIADISIQALKTRVFK